MTTSAPRLRTHSTLLVPVASDRARAGRWPGRALVTLDGRRLSALDLPEVPGGHGGRTEPNVCTWTEPEAGEVLILPRRFIEIPDIPSEQLGVLLRRGGFWSRLRLSGVMHPGVWLIGPVDQDGGTAIAAQIPDRITVLPRAEDDISILIHRVF